MALFCLLLSIQNGWNLRELLLRPFTKCSKDFLNSTFWSWLNYVRFHLNHEQNLSLSMNIAVTYCVLHFLVALICVIMQSVMAPIIYIEILKNWIGRLQLVVTLCLKHFLTRRNVHTHSHTHIHTHIYTHTHIHTYTHTHTPHTHLYIYNIYI